MDLNSALQVPGPEFVQQCIPFRSAPQVHICSYIVAHILILRVSEGMTSWQWLGSKPPQIQKLKTTLTSYSSSCPCSSREGWRGGPADLGWVCWLFSGWAGQCCSRLGWAGLGQLPWGTSAPHISHSHPGTSGPAQACSSHRNSIDAREQVQGCKHVSSSLLISHLLTSYWPNQASQSDSVGHFLIRKTVKSYGRGQSYREGWRLRCLCNLPSFLIPSCPRLS